MNDRTEAPTADDVELVGLDPSLRDNDGEPYTWAEVDAAREQMRGRLRFANYTDNDQRDATEAIMDALEAVGIRSSHYHTGGGCMTVSVVIDPTMDENGFINEILIGGGDADFPNSREIAVFHIDGKDRQDGEALLEKEGYDVAEVVAVVKARLDQERADADKPKPQRVGFAFEMDLIPGVSQDQLDHMAGAAFAQFSEPEILTPSEKWEPSITSGVTLRRYTPTKGTPRDDEDPIQALLIDRHTYEALSDGAEERGMTLPEYVAALASIDGGLS